MDYKPKEPWLVAAWPGMGAVGISAGYYLMAKLGMHLLAEFPASEYFEPEAVEVKSGLILPGRLPRSRLFLWRNPGGRHDLIVFIGEAQPAAHAGVFCAHLLGHATGLGVKRVFTFAAMATQMRPGNDSAVYGAAIDRATLADFTRCGMQALEEGQISGLNGVLLGVAAERGLSGGCMLGEMPHVFSRFSFPKASLAILEAFTGMAGVTLDLGELREQAEQVAQGLEELLHRLEGDSGHTALAAGGHEEPAAEAAEPSIAVGDVRHLEELFEAARKDRARAYELKQELDRLKVFPEYEDRFLDLFKGTG